MGLASLFAHRFWITAYACLALGFWLPGDYRCGRPLIPYLLGGILYFSCLKVGMREVAMSARDARLLLRVLALSLVKLLVLPLVTYLAMRLLAPAWASGAMLVAMMPAGLSSLAFADLFGGSRMAALALTIITSLLCPISIPFLLDWAVPSTSDGMRGMISERAGFITLLLITPFVLAQLTRLAVPGLIATHHRRWGYGSIVCICLLIFLSVAANRHHWASMGGSDLLVALGATSVASLVGALTAWPFAAWLPRTEAISFACSAVYMNNGLAVALAVGFYQGDARLLLPAILVQIPMTAGVAIIGARCAPPRALPAA